MDDEMDDEIMWSLYREANTMASIGKLQKHLAAARKTTTDGPTDDHLATASEALRRAWRHCADVLQDCLEVLVGQHDEEYPQ